MYQVQRFIGVEGTHIFNVIELKLSASMKGLVKTRDPLQQELRRNLDFKTDISLSLLRKCVMKGINPMFKSYICYDL